MTRSNGMIVSRGCTLGTRILLMSNPKISSKNRRQYSLLDAMDPSDGS